ncbi:MAG: ISL3 family transposase, partial [Porphyromonadaceae bacterium]|nr:ISL3 family transposase [Porphyromonadaceae bacterium]
MLNINQSDIDKSDIIIDGDTVYFDITLVRKPMDCPYCGSKMIGHGHKLKLIKHPAVRSSNGIIRYHANRYICKACRKTVFENNPFAMQGFNSSVFLLQQAMDKLSNLNYTLHDISKDLNISSTQLNTYIDSYIIIPPRPLPECIGIDELHSKSLSRRNSSYLCVLVDNQRRCLYDILDTRNKHHLSLYFSRFSKEDRNNVKYITIDMWEPYKEVAKTYFPNCIVAVDPFHVIWHLHRGFDALRISLMNKCEYNSTAYYLLKHWNKLLIYDNINLDNQPVFNRRFQMKLNKRDIQEMIFNTFPELERAYQLKEAYRYMNKHCSYEEACERYDRIVCSFKRSGISQYEDFTSILCVWKEEILNSFLRPYEDRKLSNSFTESFNSKLRTYLQVSNGISNFERFRKRVIYSQC